MLPNAMGNKPLRILQWNCRGLSQRRAELNHRLKDQTFDILLLQETKTDQITIPGYKQYYMPSIKHTYKKEEKIQAQAAIFIQEKMHHIIIDTSRWCTELQEVVAIRVALQSTERRLTIASAYLRPQKKRDYSWILHLRKDYPDDFMVLGGDLNVHVESWGQPNKNPQAKALYEIMEQADVTMANDPTKPTRYPTIANQRESIIDITLTPANTARMLHWTVLDDAWGSDHFPIIIELNIGAKSKHPKKQTKTIIWDKFRENLLDQGDDFEPHHVTSLLTAAAKVAVDTRQVDEDTPTPDSHLLSLWDRRTKALTLYRKKRKRKHLTKVNWLTNEASKYAKQLGLQRWLEYCETFDRHTNMGDVWRTFDSMYGKKKGISPVPVIALLSNEKIEDILNKLGEVFFPQPQKKPDPGIYQRQHTGPSQNPEDLPFTEWELDAAIKQCRTKSAPGPDGVTVPMLRNAPDPTRKAMLAWFNRIWDSGVLPDEWKTSVVTPIPKPGKPATDPKNVRPISLTSVIGKLMERMVLARIQYNASSKGIFHPTQTGFRANLSTHDSLAMIYHDVVDLPRTKRSLRVIVSIDIKKAFDSVPHASVINKMEEQGLTGKQLDFVKAFLTDRKYRVKAGYGTEAREGATKENNIGVPQGAVLSPTLFNIVIAPLLWRLHKIQLLNATAYADDVTIWTHEGTPDNQKAALQEGLDTIADFLKEVGMFPSPEKTKYTVFGKGREQTDLALTFDGDPIAKEDSIKVLGVNFGYAIDNTTKWLTEIRHKWKQGLNLVRRISHRLGGAGEKTARKLVTATLVSKVTYAARFYKLTKGHKNQFKTMLNDARRAILGLPRNTKKEELHKCVYLPEIEDLLVQQEDAQMARLHHTEEGRAIAKFMDITLPELPPLPQAKPPWEMVCLTHGTKPIPRRMHPEKNKERRQEFVKQHKAEVKTVKADANNTIAYVDGAVGPRGWTAAAVFYQGSGDQPFDVIAGSGRDAMNTPELAEERAILMALVNYEGIPNKRRNLIVYTDSQEAVKNLTKHKATSSPTIDLIFQTALRLLRNHGTRISIRWIPGHEEIPGNMVAHAAAQHEMRISSLPSRLAPDCDDTPQQAQKHEEEPYDPTEELRRARRARKKALQETWEPEVYPIPDKVFKRREMVLLRRIRTGGAVTPRLQYHITLSQLRKTQPYAVPPDPRCQRCRDPEALPNLEHILWECKALDSPRTEAIEKLPADHRPQRLTDWTYPVGDSQRRTEVLRSLLDYVSTGELASSL